MIYFDNAASSYPKPPSVINAVAKWIKQNGANPGRSGHRPAIEAASIVFDTRLALARMFGVKDCENIAFVPNATYGLNILIQGLVDKNDHIITTVFEHNSVLRPLFYMQKTMNIDIDICDVDLYDDNMTINNILSKIKSNTRLVVCTQCSNVCGKVMPIKKLASKLPTDVKLIVDGSQGAGIIPIDLQNDGVDYYCAPSHKGLLGIQGAGFIAINSSIPRSIISGGTGSESANPFQPDYMPDIFESGTLPTPSIVSVYEGVRFIDSYGIGNVYDHKRKLVLYADKRLKSLNNVITYTDTEKSDFVGTICFNVKNKHSDEVAKYLSDNGICVRSGIHCAPLWHKKFGTENSGAVRISFSVYNNANQIDEMIKKLNIYIKN